MCLPGLVHSNLKYHLLIIKLICLIFTSFRLIIHLKSPKPQQNQNATLPSSSWTSPRWSNASDASPTLRQVSTSCDLRTRNPCLPACKLTTTPPTHHRPGHMEAGALRFYRRLCVFQPRAGNLQNGPRLRHHRTRRYTKAGIFLHSVARPPRIHVSCEGCHSRRDAADQGFAREAGPMRKVPVFVKSGPPQVSTMKDLIYQTIDEMLGVLQRANSTCFSEEKPWGALHAQVDMLAR